MMTRQEVDARDRRRVAVHEAAHAAVARHYGIEAHTSIWRSAFPEDDYVTTTTWSGRNYFGKGDRTRQRVRRIAIAGVMAEIFSDIEDGDLNLGGFSLWESLEALRDSYEYEEWSSTDFLYAQGWTSRDHRAVHSLLKRKWKEILQEATWLIEASIATEPTGSTWVISNRQSWEAKAGNGMGRK